MGLFIANYTKEDFLEYVEEYHWNTQGEKEFFSSFYDFVEKLEDDPLEFEDFFVNFTSYDGMNPVDRRSIIREIDAVFKDERYAVPQELKDSFQKNVVSRDIEKELADIKAKEDAGKLDEVVEDEAKEDDEYYLADPDVVAEVAKGIKEQKPQNDKNRKEFEELQTKKDLGILYGDEEDIYKNLLNMGYGNDNEIYKVGQKGRLARKVDLKTFMMQAKKNGWLDKTDKENVRKLYLLSEKVGYGELNDIVNSIYTDNLALNSNEKMRYIEGNIKPVLMDMVRSKVITSSLMYGILDNFEYSEQEDIDELYEREFGEKRPKTKAEEEFEKTKAAAEPGTIFIQDYTLNDYIEKARELGWENGMDRDLLTALYDYRKDNSWNKIGRIDSLLERIISKPAWTVKARNEIYNDIFKTLKVCRDWGYTNKKFEEKISGLVAECRENIDQEYLDETYEEKFGRPRPSEEELEKEVKEEQEKLKRLEEERRENERKAEQERLAEQTRVRLENEKKSFEAAKAAMNLGDDEKPKTSLDEDKYGVGRGGEIAENLINAEIARQKAAEEKARFNALKDAMKLEEGEGVERPEGPENKEGRRTAEKLLDAEQRRQAAERQSRIDSLEPGVTTEERINRAKYIYNNLRTMEEKLQFLIDYRVEALAAQELGVEGAEEEVFAGEEFSMDFVDHYFANASIEDKKKVIAYLEKINVENAINTDAVKQEYLKTSVSADDPKADKKAYYLARTTTRFGLMTSSLIILKGPRMTPYIQSGQDVIDQVTKDLNISPETTYADIAAYLGFEGEYRDAFMAGKGATLETKIMDHFKQKLIAQGSVNPSDERIKTEIIIFIMPYVMTSWIHEAQQQAMNDLGLSDEQKKALHKTLERNNTEVSTSGIKEWADKDAEKIVRVNGFESNLQTRNDFRTKYASKIKGYNDEKEIKAEAANVLTGTPEERYKKLVEIYDSLPDLESQLEYIIRLKANILAKQEIDRSLVSEDERKVPDLMLDEFIEKYIVNGDKSTRQRAFEKTNSIGEQINREIVDEKIKIYKELNENDPELRETKAYYLARTNPKTASLNAAFYNASLNIQDTYFKDKTVRGSELEGINITEETTMEEYARMVGFREDEIEAFLEEEKAMSETSVLDHFIIRLLNENPNKNPEDIRVKDAAKKNAFDYILEKRGELWAKRARRNYHKSIGLSDEEMKMMDSYDQKRFDGASQKGIGEWDGPDENGVFGPRHSDWVKTVGKDYEDSHKLERTKAALNEFKKAYIIPGDKIINRFDAVDSKKNRIKGSTKNAYSYLVDYDKKTESYRSHPLSDKNVEELKTDLGVDIADAPRKIIEDQGTVFTDPEYVRRVEHAQFNSRGNTQVSMLTLWALGTQDHIDIPNFTNLVYNGELVEKYTNFCVENPTLKAQDEKTYKESVKKWTDILLKATEKIKKYKLPEIDYSDPEQFKKYIGEIAKLNTLCVDFMQERDRMFNNSLGLDGVRYAEEAMGGNKWNETLTFWGELQNLLSYFNGGYMLEFNGASTEDAMIKITDKLFNKSTSDQILNGLAGKSLEDAMKSAGVDKIIGAKNAIRLSRILEYDGEYGEDFNGLETIDRVNMMKFANGKDKKPFSKLYNNIRNRSQNISVRETNDICKEKLYINFMFNIDLSEIGEELKNLPDTKEATLEFLNNTALLEPSGKTRSTAITKNIGRIFGEDYRFFMTEAGFKNIDCISVNGKSPEELWGRKYSGVEAGLKERCYYLEIMKAIASGNNNVTAKTFGIGPDGKVRVTGDACISPSKDRIYELNQIVKVYNNGVKRMTDTLEGLQRNLLSTHDTQDMQQAREEIGSVGSSLFKDMESTLDDEESKPDEIRKALKAYQKAAATYYKERKSIFGKKDGAAIRLDSAELGSDAASEMLVYFDNLRAGLDTDILTLNGYTKEVSIHDITSALEDFKDAKRAGIYEYDVPDLPEAAINGMADELKEISELQNNAEKDIKNGLDKLGMDSEKLLTKPNEVKDPYEAAVAYLAEKAKRNIYGSKNNVNSIKVISSKINRSLEDGSFKKEATSLSKNHVFKEVMKRGMNFDKWARIEKQADAMIKSMSDSMNEINNTYPDISKFIMKDPDGKISSADKKYEKLGDYVSKQILTDPANRVIVQAIEAGYLDARADVVKVVVENLKQQKLIEKNDPGTLKDAISTGKLKKDMIDKIIKSAQKKVQNTAKEKAAEQEKKKQGPKM